MLEINKIHNLDCLEGMRQIPDNTVDLIITSPPYNLGGDFHTFVNGSRQSHGGYNSYDDNMPEAEYQQWQIDIINEMVRVIKPDGNIFYNHKNRLKNFVTISPLEWILKTKAILRQEIVWNTTNAINWDMRRFTGTTEKIFWLSKTITHLKNDRLKLKDYWYGRNENKRKKINHPATFPELLPNNIMASLPNTAGLLVLDPFVGSGTTIVRAIVWEMDYIGLELDPEYCQIANKRIKNQSDQLRMC